MNAIILALACGGALAVFLTTDPQDVAAAREQEVGSMTHDITVNPATGEEEETNVIAFLDP